MKAVQMYFDEHTDSTDSMFMDFILLYPDGTCEIAATVGKRVTWLMVKANGTQAEVMERFKGIKDSIIHLGEIK